MSDFKGTPGPWKVNTIGQHWNNESLVHLEVTFGFEGECICDTVYQREDANLIAAAPELLEAIQGVMFDVTANRAAINDSRIEEIRAAIAKALGQ